jgi:hypothetical protein
LKRSARYPTGAAARSDSATDSETIRMNERFDMLK